MPRVLPVCRLFPVCRVLLVSLALPKCRPYRPSRLDPATADTVAKDRAQIQTQSSWLEPGSGPSCLRRPVVVGLTTPATVGESLMSTPMSIGSAPPETVLADAPAAQQERLSAALATPSEGRRDLVAEVVMAYPDWPEAWAELGELARDEIEAYSAFRVGYHRGLDHLRKSGWQGSGYVRWTHRGNRGFLRCLAGLAALADAIGESAEAERCAVFLRQLDPSWPPADLAGASAPGGRFAAQGGGVTR